MSTAPVNQQVAGNLIQLRQTIDEYRMQIDQHRAAPSSSMSEEEAAKMFYGPVSSFLAQAEPVLTENAIEGSETLLNDVHLGAVTVNPPPIKVKPKAPGGLDPRAEEIAAIRDRYADEKPEYELSKESDLPEPKTKTVHGIKPLLSDNAVAATWSVEIVGRRVGSSMETVGVGDLGKQATISNATPWPVGVLYQAVRETTKTLTNAGIGFNAPERT